MELDVSAAPETPLWSRTAVSALAVLTTVNLLNYVDRFVITAVLPDIQRDLGLSDTQGGLLGTAFIVVYALASPVFGWLGDRGQRQAWIAAGVALWSVATGLAGLAQRFATLFLARASVGIGEASYGTIAPALLSDLFPPRWRGRVMAIFFLATPVGTALGYLLGGALGERFGWRATFFAVGFPGLALAALTLTLRAPARGAADGVVEPPPSLGRAYRELGRNRLYLWTVLGYAAYTFAIGGMAYWAPSYLMRARGLGQSEAGLLFGGITVVTGIVGTLAGGFLGDRLLAVTPKAYTWLGTIGVSAGALLILAALSTASVPGFLVLLAAGEVLLFLNTGPINAIIVNAVRPAIRATAMAVSILVIHVLGDAVSPTLIGVLSDRTDLSTALLAIPGVFLLAAALWAMTLPRRRRS
jgi:predicted MFS family arabinose efflux permease